MNASDSQKKLPTASAAPESSGSSFSEGAALGRINPMKMIVGADRKPILGPDGEPQYAIIGSDGKPHRAAIAPDGTYRLLESPLEISEPAEANAVSEPVRDADTEEKSQVPDPETALMQARAQARGQNMPTRRKVEGAGDEYIGSGSEEGLSSNLAPFSNIFGFLHFLYAIFPLIGHKQMSDAKLEALKKSMAQGGSSQSLFAAMDAPLQGLTPEDIPYANDVDAAMSRCPSSGARLLSGFIFVFFVVLIIWSAFVEIDEVTHSEGSVVGSRKTQSISNLEGGILRSILVTEGQTVQKEDVLAQIDNEMAASSYRDAVNRSLDDAMALIRLEAELKGVGPEFPTDLASWVASQISSEVESTILLQAQQIVRDQKSTYQSRKRKFEADEAVLKSQAAQRERDVQEQLSRKSQLVKSLDLAAQQRDAARLLLQRNNFSRLEFLTLEQKVVELKGNVDMLDASIPRAEAAANEAKHRIESHRAENKAAITEEINKRRVELATLHETISAGSDRVTRTDMRSPVRGIIKQIHLNTIGGVVKPGEPIMDIVPLDDTLLVEAKVKPQDVAFLRPGQDVMVKVTAYDFSIYGGLEGKLEQISADTIEDKRGEFYYLVKVRTKKTSLVYHNEVLPIIPGMLVQADILIGKKTILQYLVKPILKAKQNALTER